jgi:hypothetical protein
MSNPRDHHYVPQFLLARWCKPSGKLTVYRRAQGRVVVSDLHPKSTAFERDLYSFQKVLPARQHAIETEFMSRRIDDPAAPIVRKLVDGDLASLTTDERSNFARFVLSMRARHPDAVALARAEGERVLRAALGRNPEEYLSAKAETSPATFIEWVEQNANGLIPNFGISLVPGVIANDAVGARLFDMPWSTYDARHASTDFVIGDRPCLLEGDAVSGDFIIALPLSPTVIFLICSQEARIAGLRRARPNDVVKWFNKASVIYASSRVYAIGNHHKPLVDKHLKR